MGVIVQEVTTEATVTETSVSVNVQQTENSITVTSPLPTAVAVTSPITNTGSSTAPIIGINQTLLSIQQTQVSGLVTALTNKLDTGLAVLLSGGNTISGDQVINSSSSTSFPLSIRAASGQTSNLFRIRNSADTGDLFSVDSSGQVRTPTVINPTTFNNSRILLQNTGVLIDTQITSNVPLAVRGSNGQTANLQSWQTWDGTTATTVASINSAGLLSLTRNLTLAQINAGENSVIIRGAANQVGYQGLWQNSSGTVLAGISPIAQIFTGSQTPISAVGNTITINSQTPTYSSPNTTISTASAHGVAVGQTVTLQGFTQGQYNQTWIAQAGTSGTNLVIRTNSDFGPTLSGGSARVSAQVGITSSSSTTTGLIVRGAPSQAHNLMEWQDSNATLLGYINNGGALRAFILQSDSANFDARTANGGGQITMLKQTAAASNAGANYARLYFRDGTNAGTLRLVVRAGAAGAETTIFDNIPT